MGLFSKKHSIGKTIAELRKAKGWTQIELAEKLQVSDKAISKWEKDRGAPSIEFFPALAELFDVSIDYLMTGKETEPEIITMSKIELCAKNDDVELFETLSDEYLKSADESGKTILDYMLEYNCVKVINAFFKKYPARTIQQSNSYRAGAPLWYTEKVLKLLIINNLIDELSSINLLTRNMGRQMVATEWNIYTEKYRTLIFTHEKIGEDLKKLYIQSLNESEFNTTICLLLDNKKENDIQLLWKIVYNKSTIKLSLSTLQKLLDNGYIETVKQANQMNKTLGAPTISEELIQVAILKQNGGKAEEINRLSVMQNGIVNIDKLLDQKDFKFIKKMLIEYPIHIVELLEEWLSESKWKELYRFAIDNNNESLANAIIAKDDKEYIRRTIQEYFKKENYNFNKKHFYLYENSRQKSIVSPNKEQFNKIKQRIIDELALKIDKDSTVGDLTKEYFERELGKGNTDMVIIKLCVRLEAVLRCDYHYEGDLSAMLDKYCSGFNTYDDEGNDYDPYTPRVLNKLGMKRNNIVHSEKNSVELTLEELKYCMDYICKMG